MAALLNIGLMAYYKFAMVGVSEVALADEADASWPRAGEATMK